MIKKLLMALLVIHLFLLLIFSSKMLARTIIHCSEGSPEGFSPALYTSSTTYDSTQPIYETLVGYDGYPALAESWSPSTDGKTLTFHLRKGVKFHSTKYFQPTRDFNADDVLFSFERQMNKRHSFHKINGASYEYFDAMGMHSIISEIRKLDDYTIELQLKQPDASIIGILSMDFLSIYSEEYASTMLKRSTPEYFDQKPVGTGPFVLTSYQKDSNIRYRAHTDYWGRKPDIDNLIFSITPDASVRYQKTINGECHTMLYPSIQNMRNIEENEYLNVINQVLPNIGYLSYNTQSTPFDNPKVRNALNMAINKKELVKIVFGEYGGVVATSLLSPIFFPFDITLQDTPFDPIESKKILNELGLNYLEIELLPLPEQRPYNPAPLKMAELIKSYWANIGVTTKISRYPWGEFLKRSKNHNGAVLIGWTADNLDPLNIIEILLSCDTVGKSNRARWCYKPFNDIITNARATYHPGERGNLYREAHLIFKDQAPILPIAHSINPLIVRREVQDYVFVNPIGGFNFKGLPSCAEKCPYNHNKKKCDCTKK